MDLTTAAICGRAKATCVRHTASSTDVVYPFPITVSDHLSCTAAQGYIDIAHMTTCCCTCIVHACSYPCKRIPQLKQILPTSRDVATRSWLRHRRKGCGGAGRGWGCGGRHGRSWGCGAARAEGSGQDCHTGQTRQGAFTAQSFEMRWPSCAWPAASPT